MKTDTPTLPRPGGAEAMREAAAKVCDANAAAHRAARADLPNGPDTVSERAMRGAAALASEGLAERIRALPLPAGDTLSTGGWRPIATAPRGREVLLLDNSTGTHAFYSVGFRPPIDGEWQIEASRDYDFTPSHWMPLPEPPPGE